MPHWQCRTGPFTFVPTKPFGVSQKNASAGKRDIGVQSLQLCAARVSVSRKGRISAPCEPSRLREHHCYNRMKRMRRNQPQNSNGIVRRVITSAFGLSLLMVIGNLVGAALAFGQGPQVKLDVDATDAQRKILHAHLRIPAQSGKLTLL